MKRRSKQMVAWTAIAGSGAAAAWLFYGAEPDQGLTSRATILAGVVALVVFVGSCVSLLFTRGGDGDSIPAEVLDSAAASLQRAARTFWESEATYRGITAPMPAAVRWTWSTDDTAAPFEEVSEGIDTVASGAVTCLGPDLYDLLPDDRARILITGPPGSGKTGALLLLLLHVLSSAPTSAPIAVPVLLSMSSWNARRTAVIDWAATVIGRDYPGLQHGMWSAERVAHELLRTRRVALFLDGLDEMPLTRRSPALTELSQQGALRWVLTSRPAELREALETVRMHRTSVVETLPMEAAAASDFLLREQRAKRRELWETVLTHIKANPESPASLAFQTPLALSLARETYSTEGDPAELIDESRFPTQEAVFGHLVTRLLHMAYPHIDERIVALKRLRWIARHSDGRDIAWWRLVAIPGLRGSPRALAARRSRHVESERQPRHDATRSDGPDGPAAALLRGDPKFRVGAAWVIVWIVGLVIIARLIQLHVIDAAEIERRLGAPTSRKRTSFELVLGLGAGFLFGVLIGRVASRSTGQLGLADPSLPATIPNESFTNEMRFAVRGGLACGLGTLVLFITYDPLFALSASVAASTMFAAGPGVGLRLTEEHLALRGYGRIRILEFLDEAARRQLLRQVGPIYQFRHAVLHDQLRD